MRKRFLKGLNFKGKEVKKMKNYLLKSVVLVALLFATLVISPAAHAVPTLVQFDPAGGGSYSILGIQEFDWQSSGNLVVEQVLVSSSNGATTLGGFFALGPTSGVDTLTMDIHAHARLNDFLDINGASIVASGLSRDGGTTGSWEVTGTLDGQETATYYNIGGHDVLAFTGITGAFQYYLDGTPDSVVTSGAGFNDGDIGAVPFLSGTLTLISGSFDGTAGNGATYLTNTITAYDPNVIETDPTNPNVWLIGTTFDSTIKFVTSLQPSVGVGGVIGDAPYTVLAGDLILNADASSEFDAVPEPATMLLFGTGLIGLAGACRRKFKK
ncbi:MAG: PEP-CTERM sorting domain-containing protein [Thermodesulfobacteriota bacterium]|nr:PEP-CTERM sorting domain-containing protein [Thermodesulfobacteriota bacterium]